MVILITTAPIYKGADREQRRIQRPGVLFLVALVLVTTALFGCGGGLSTTDFKPQSDPLATGTATLTWEAPSTRMDGTDLNDLMGFKIYYGDLPSTYKFVTNVGNVSSYQVAGLVQGRTYYFSVTAYDASGNESDYSSERTKLVN